MLKDLPNNSMNTDTQQPLATRLLLAGYTHLYAAVGKAMKKCPLFVFAVLLFGCGQTDVVEVRLTDYDLKIDVRTKKEYDFGHLDGAVNIPYTEIGEKIQEHTKDKNKKIMLYCRSGRRSGIARRILQDVGFKNAVNAGAYENLKKQELEIKKKKTRQ